MCVLLSGLGTRLLVVNYNLSVQTKERTNPETMDRGQDTPEYQIPYSLHVHFVRGPKTHEGVPVIIIIGTCGPHVLAMHSIWDPQNL